MAEAPESEALHDIAGLGQGDHVCAIYEDVQEQVPAIVAYIKGGLESGERCLYIVDDRTGEEVYRALEAAGVEVGAARDAGRLQLFTKRETYLSGGSFDPQRMVQSLARMTDAAVADGCRGLRISGEMTWALGKETGCDRLIEYETLLNGFFPGSRAHAICQYNRQRFAPAIIRDVLRTHPKAVIGRAVCPNPYYEPPELLRSEEGDRLRVQYMIAQLAGARAAQARLEDLNERLEAAVRARDEFLAIASHELRMPLNALQLATDLMRAEVRKRNLGDVDSVALSVQRQLARLTALIEQLLDVSRLDEDQVDLEYTPADLFAIVREVAARFELDAREAGSEVRIEGASVPGVWDTLRVEQVVANLLSNALKYGRGAPVTIRVRARGDEAIVTVADGGVGIPRVEQARLFRRYERLSSGRGIGGLGLGLWIVHELVTRMGGRVRVESAPGRGSEFTVELPRRLASAAAS